MRSLTKNRNVCTLFAAAALIAFGDATPAFAQTDSRTTTVQGRERPELDALGVRAGGFTAFPSLEVEGTYDDNIFLDETGEIDDFVTKITPTLRLNSNWSSHSLRFSGTGDIVRYADNSAEDNETFKLRADGVIDVRAIPASHSAPVSTKGWKTGRPSMTSTGSRRPISKFRGWMSGSSTSGTACR